ncbi:hypothetical protein CERZMDRAFT_92965 [Cercospora zeae-maydis SCOH1-5]|uniref:Endonuclease/exonuclease/phosphatase domain-containing protein n=1 Tax=Cercospora zeae-maydis SCOH1-5 TaxID=717836 RepID=A0A6A6FTS1_9PEZI|nr:hypothetical protein CERZMDRAFT_92965 [Cercospora zeae-maydis SCOH1-5]
MLGYVRLEAQPSTSPRFKKPMAMLVQLLLSLKTVCLGAGITDERQWPPNVRATTAWDEGRPSEWVSSTLREKSLWSHEHISDHRPLSAFAYQTPEAPTP